MASPLDVTSDAPPPPSPGLLGALLSRWSATGTAATADTTIGTGTNDESSSGNGSTSATTTTTTTTTTKTTTKTGRKVGDLRKQQFKLAAAHSFLSNISLGPDDPTANTPVTPEDTETYTDVATERRQSKTRRKSVATEARRTKSVKRRGSQALSGDEDKPLSTPTGVDNAQQPLQLSRIQAIEHLEAARENVFTPQPVVATRLPVDNTSPSDFIGPPTASIPDVLTDSALRSRTNTMDSTDVAHGGLRSLQRTSDGDLLGGKGELEGPVSSTSFDPGLRGSRVTLGQLRKDSIGSTGDVGTPFINKLVEVDHLDREHLRQVAFDHLPARLFFSTVRHTMSSFPFVVSSVLRYDEERLRKKKKAAATAATTNMGDMDLLGLASQHDVVSYEELLSDEHRETEEENYDPNYLDDPELRTGKHCVVLTIPSVRVRSLLHYIANEADLRLELNEQFRLKHPQLDPSITLSKIRKLKLLLIEVALSPDLELELSTVALAFVYLEKLVFKKFLRKANRKVLAGVCLILAAKINDPQFVVIGDRMNIQSLKMYLEEHLKVTSKALKDAEFSVFAALDFHLHVTSNELLPHFERIITAQQYSNVQEYLGPEMYRLFFSEPTMSAISSA